MNSQDPQSHPFSPFKENQRSGENKPNWSSGKKAGVALGGLVALGAAFFVGFGTGYDNAKADIAASFNDAFGESFAEPATDDAVPVADDYDTDADADIEVQDPLAGYPTTLTVGDSVDVPCSMHTPEAGVCMTLTLTDLNPNTVCEYSRSEPGRYVALTFDASMPTDADPEFTSPFRSSPWDVITEDNRITGTREEVSCAPSSNHLDLMDEFPGYSATGTAWLPVPDNATEVHFEAGREHLFSVPVGQSSPVID